MGRIAGVTAEETRVRVLQGAASVFARKGYDGASIADIASAAGVSSGAIYAHFGSKAELFAAILHEQGPAELERLLDVGSGGGGGGRGDAGRALRRQGEALARRAPEEGSLLVEAIVAARRHPEVAALLLSAFAEREERFAALIRAGQRDGAVDRRIRPAAASRFVTMLALGSVLVAAMDLPAVDDKDWALLIRDMVSRFNAPQPAT